MTKDEIEIALSFEKVTFLPGSWAKRFSWSMRHMATLRASEDLSNKQREFLYRLLYTFRAQNPEMYEKFKNHPLCTKAENKK